MEEAPNLNQKVENATLKNYSALQARGWILLRMNFNDDFVGSPQITERRPEPSRRKLNLVGGYFHWFTPFGEVHCPAKRLN